MKYAYRISEVKGNFNLNIFENYDTFVRCHIFSNISALQDVFDYIKQLEEIE